jgi:hypothetical protein
MTVDRRNEILRVVGVGVGAPLALAVTQPRSTAGVVAIGVAGAVAGVLLAFGFEHLFDWRADVKALLARITELEGRLESAQQLNRLLEHKVRITKAEADINAIHVKVWGGAFTEAQTTGHFLPLSAILARIEVEQRAAGLDKPIPPLDP